MSKKKYFARSVAFGYGAIVSQIFYSFASIPLALSHLSTAEFGMWGLSSTIVGYLMLAEMGMTNAVTRHLLECKDGRDNGKYGRLFTGSAIALGIVALSIAGLGLLASQTAWRFFPIPGELLGRFVNLMIGQTLLLSLTMATQMLGVPLYVHHRQDLSQINQIGLFVIYYVVLRLAFKAEWGIYAMLANQAAGYLWSICFNFFACSKLGLYPKIASLGLPNRDEWTSVWRYSRDVFSIQVGALLLSSIPQLTVARLLGLEANAMWTITTRSFAILRQMVGRPFDVALPLIYDDYIRGDMKAVTGRWTDVTQGILAVAGTVFVVAAANNSAFIDLWTHGRIHWGEANQWLLALYFFTITAASLASGGLGMEMAIGKSRFIGFIQVPLTIALVIPLAELFGLAGLILGSTLPYMLGIIPFGVRYLASITNHANGPLLWQGILRPTLATPLAALGAWLCSSMNGCLPGYYGLIFSGASGTLVAMAAMMTIGVSTRIRNQLTTFAWKTVSRFLPKRSVAL